MKTKDKRTLQEKSHLPEKLRALREEYGLSRKSNTAHRHSVNDQGACGLQLFRDSFFIQII
ncbi:MAG: hypothetical protein LUE14_00840 [Clostridiales bacterium]|nr:hypothetical protein [Clostridiales bacterium]